MKTWENLRLLSGYLPEIDRLPREAMEFGLCHRAAVILNYSDVPHSSLYWDLLEAIVESVPADSVIFETDTTPESIRCTSLLTLREYTTQRPDIAIPFNHAVFKARGQVVALLELEPWDSCGGPFPYSDSWTFSLYRATYNMTNLRTECYAVCARFGLPILAEITGSPAPEKESWWRHRLRRLFD